MALARSPNVGSRRRGELCFREVSCRTAGAIAPPVSRHQATRLKTAVGEGPGELRAVADVEFPIPPAEMRLDRLRAEEQLRGRLADRRGVGSTEVILDVERYGAHLSLAAIGLVVVTASSWPSSTTHNDVDGHETPVNVRRLLSMSTNFLHVGVGTVGLVVVPGVSELVGHYVQRPRRARNPSRGVQRAGAADVGVGPQVACADSGLVEINAFPHASTATHSDVAIHDTP